MKKYLSFFMFLFCGFIFAQTPTLSITPSQGTVIPNQSVTFHIDVNGNGFAQQLFFSINSTNLPSANYTSSFTINPLNPPYTSGTDLVIQTNGSMPISTYSITVKASNASTTTYSTCNLTVTPLPCNWSSKLIPYSPASYDLVIDKEGNKWIKAGGGLVKYNGTNWTKYDATNSNLPSNFGKIAIDSQSHTIWIPANGLMKFDGTYWTNYNTTNSAIPGDGVGSVVIDSLNNKWMGIGNVGLVKFDGANWTSYTMANSPLPSANVSNLTFDHSGNLWMQAITISGTGMPTTVAIVKFDGTNWTVYDANTFCFVNYIIESNFAFDQDNNLWFSVGYPNNNPSDGLIKFDGTTWEAWQKSTTSPYNHWKKDANCNLISQDNQSQLPEPFGRQVLIDKYNGVWIANMSNTMGVGGGLTHFDGATWETFLPSNSNIPKPAVLGMDYRNDTLWAVTGPDFYSWVGADYHLSYYGCKPKVTAIDESVKFSFSNVYPNPFSTTAHFDFKENVRNAEIELYDFTGRKVKTFSNINGKSFELERGDLSKGMYFYLLKDGNQLLDKGKLIME